MRKLEIRCCCKPEKLLGVISVKKRLVKKGSRIEGGRIAWIQLEGKRYLALRSVRDHAH